MTSQPFAIVIGARVTWPKCDSTCHVFFENAIRRNSSQDEIRFRIGREHDSRNRKNFWYSNPRQSAVAHTQQQNRTQFARKSNFSRRRWRRVAAGTQQSTAHSTTNESSTSVGSTYKRTHKETRKNNKIKNTIFALFLHFFCFLFDQGMRALGPQSLQFPQRCAFFSSSAVSQQNR